MQMKSKLVSESDTESRKQVMIGIFGLNSINQCEFRLSLDNRMINRSV